MKALRRGHCGIFCRIDRYRKLTDSERRVLQRLRSDRLISLRRVKEVLGFSDTTRGLKFFKRFIDFADIPVYTFARGRFYCFSRDVVESLNKLDIVHNEELRGIFEGLYTNRDRLNRGWARAVAARTAQSRGPGEDIAPFCKRPPGCGVRGDPIGSFRRERGCPSKSESADFGRVLADCEAAVGPNNDGSDSQSDSDAGVPGRKRKAGRFGKDCWCQGNATGRAAASYYQSGIRERRKEEVRRAKVQARRARSAGSGSGLDPGQSATA